MERIRSSSEASGGLTDEEWTKLKEHHTRWRKVISRTQPIENEKIKMSVHQLYSLATLATPQVLVVSSPGVMAFAGVFAKFILEEQAKNNAFSYTRPNSITVHCKDEYREIVSEVIKTISQIVAADTSTFQGVNNTDVSSCVLNVAFDLVYGATADALDRETNTDLRQGLDHLALCDLQYAINEAMVDEFRNPTLTALMQTHIVEWGSELAKQLFNDESSVATVLKGVAEWWSDTQSGAANVYHDYCMTAAHEVLGIVVPGYENYKVLLECNINSVYRFMRPEFCLVCDFPNKIVDKNLDHIAVGTGQNFYHWKDGWSV